MSVNPFHAKYFEDVKCRRHGEAACPSCLSYALSDANAAFASARAEGAAEEREALLSRLEWRAESLEMSGRPGHAQLLRDEAAGFRGRGEVKPCATCGGTRFRHPKALGIPCPDCAPKPETPRHDACCNLVETGGPCNCDVGAPKPDASAPDNWEGHECQRATCCHLNEERAEKAEAANGLALKALRELVTEFRRFGPRVTLANREEPIFEAELPESWLAQAEAAIAALEGKPDVD